MKHFFILLIVVAVIFSLFNLPVSKAAENPYADFIDMIEGYIPRFGLGIFQNSPFYATGTDGNVGLGTTEPDSKLSVIGDVQVSNDLTVDSNTNVGILSFNDAVASGKVNMTGHSVTGLSAPTNNNDAATKAYVDALIGGDACIVSGNNIICSGIPANSNGSLLITKNGVTCPIWKDCDGDTKTYGYGDCDESCPTCYVGSIAYTTKPDGKDQDCNGMVDEKTGGQTCYDQGLFPKTCNEICSDHGETCVGGLYDCSCSEVGCVLEDMFCTASTSKSCICEEAIKYY